jgi:hypothetical protein
VPTGSCDESVAISKTLSCLTLCLYIRNHVAGDRLSGPDRDLKAVPFRFDRTGQDHTQSCFTASRAPRVRPVSLAAARQMLPGFGFGRPADEAGVLDARRTVCPSVLSKVGSFVPFRKSAITTETGSPRRGRRACEPPRR